MAAIAELNTKERETKRTTPSMSKTKEEEEEKQGVLLYYKYTSSPIENLNQLFTFYESNCFSLGLLGRVRLAPQGVNVTIGGKLSLLHNHIAALLDSYGGFFEGTDFKLASCDEPLSMEVAKECGFTSLSIRIVKELVTLSSNPLIKTPSISNAGRHLSALEFHSVLQNSGELLKEESPIDFKKLVLLDARNLYETRIGKFESPEVETLDPVTRQYSDLPAWIDSNADKLRGNCVLMYCTGGIRCEMASAYIRSKGAGFENVFQLYGGIQRYLEQFPDGGFFKGKNFVYDPRISVGSSSKCIMGKCLLCGTSFDDYSSRCRCAFCRMLVLVCIGCQKENSQYACELCQKHGKVAQSVPLVNDNSPEVILACDVGTAPTDCPTPLSASHSQLPCMPGSSKKLRILCLHGFRQNASSFKGRTASLAKKLKSLAEFVFVNAPHELPFIYQPRKPDKQCISSPPHHDYSPPTKNCSKKYAWLVAPDFNKKEATHWERIDKPFDPLQYQQQTEGFTESLLYLKSVVSKDGPFDGILGFSQGAAMVALICAERGRLDLELGFRFVILCSGFAVNLAGHEKGSITLPTLHVFGSEDGGDRQISSGFSRDLSSYFEDGCRVIIEHDSGHIIPTRPPYIDEVKEFLRRFM
ncbi:rhodanese-like domain-containing protein 6 [Chenopodium quinoa]|uniref:rhodanese-like domain-containing protein 6 n=1 Tax=Chenopodium quinoa TaxID=63459 RepID=UPI000B7731EB|nr:rhodanese-like domain-containing protein 6 [Chenopodium quinoa]